MLQGIVPEGSRAVAGQQALGLRRLYTTDWLGAESISVVTVVVKLRGTKEINYVIDSTWHSNPTGFFFLSILLLLIGYPVFYYDTIKRVQYSEIKIQLSTHIMKEDLIKKIKYSKMEILND